MSRLIRTLFPIITLALLACSPKPPAQEAAKETPPAAAPPSLDFGSIDISPASGSGREATFRVAFKSGAQKPGLVGLLINAQADGAGSCYVFLNVAANNTFLVADSGSAQLLLGDKDSVGNKQCEVLRDGTGSSDEGSRLVATYHVRFRPAFRGAKQLWVAPEDASGRGPEMKRVGEWTIQ